MSAELAALEVLAADYTGGLYRINPLSLAVLFYATKYWKARSNWLSDNNPLDSISDSDWDEIQAAVDNLLYEAKNPMIGFIAAFATATLPAGVLACDGSIYDRVDYPNLYAALDTVFILDADSFRVPDLRGRTVIGAGAGAGLTTRAAGDTGGEETHILLISELAIHVHSVADHGVSLAVAPGELPVSTPSLFPTTTGSTGSDDPHENMQPFFTLQYGIVAL